MLGIGIWLAVDDNAFDAIKIASSAGMNDKVWSTAVYIMISVGALLFLVGFLGCVGAMRADRPGNNCPLTLYIVIVKLIIVLEIISVILAAIFWNSINDSVKMNMTKDVYSNYTNETSDDGLSVAWNHMQVWWKCCGGQNYTDYRQSYYETTTKNPVPYTCCVMTKGSKGNSEQDVVNKTLCYAEANKPYNQNTAYDYLNAQGCYDGLKDFIGDNSGLLIGITCGFIALEIVGVIFACILRKSK